MASLQQLHDDIVSWLNRRAIEDEFPSWVRMTETQLAETLRARCMVKEGVQPIDAKSITLPPDFATMADIRDYVTGEMLELKDAWTGHYATGSNGWVDGAVLGYSGPSTAYRLIGDCIEFLPHPLIPSPPDPAWVPQNVLMRWYGRPKPLVLPSDTNPILEQLYACYLFGVCKYGAIWALDDDRAAQMDAAWAQEITRANNHKQFSDYSGAPYRAEISTVF